MEVTTSRDLHSAAESGRQRIVLRPVLSHYPQAQESFLMHLICTLRAIRQTHTHTHAHTHLHTHTFTRMHAHSTDRYAGKDADS